MQCSFENPFDESFDNPFDDSFDTPLRFHVMIHLIIPLMSHAMFH